MSLNVFVLSFYHKVILNTFYTLFYKLFNLIIQTFYILYICILFLLFYIFCLILSMIFMAIFVAGFVLYCDFFLFFFLIIWQCPLCCMTLWWHIGDYTFKHNVLLPSSYVFLQFLVKQLHLKRCFVFVFFYIVVLLKGLNICSTTDK